MAKTSSEKIDIDIIASISQRVSHANLQGITVEKIVGECLTMRMPYRDELLGHPASGAIHGGALTLLLDHTLGLSSLCCRRMEPCLPSTLDLRIDYLQKSVLGMDILATASVYKVTHRVVFIEGFAYCESPENPIAKATGSFVRLQGMEVEKLYQFDTEVASY